MPVGSVVFPPNIDGTCDDYTTSETDMPESNIFFGINEFASVNFDGIFVRDFLTGFSLNPVTNWIKPISN